MLIVERYRVVGGGKRNFDKYLIIHVKFSKEGKAGPQDRRRIWRSGNNSGRDGKERRKMGKSQGANRGPRWFVMGHFHGMSQKFHKRHKFVLH